MGHLPGRISFWVLLPVFVTGCRLDIEITDLHVVNHYSVAQLTVTSPGVADGVTPVIITIGIKKNGVFAQNFVPSISVTGSGNTIGACTPTNASGVSTCELRSTVAELKTISMQHPASGLTASVTFNPYVPLVAGFAISNGGGVTTGAGITSHASIGLPFSPIVQEAADTPGSTRARSGLHGVLFESLY